MVVFEVFLYFVLIFDLAYGGVCKPTKDQTIPGAIIPIRRSESIQGSISESSRQATISESSIQGSISEATIDDGEKFCHCFKMEEKFTEEIKKTTLPWQVFITKPDDAKIICPAIVVNHRNLIISGQCLDGITADQIRVRVQRHVTPSLYNYEKDFEPLKVKKIVRISPSGVDAKGRLGILELEIPLEFSPNLGPACINFKETDKNYADGNGWASFSLLNTGVVRTIELVEKDLPFEKKQIYDEVFLLYFKDMDEKSTLPKVGDVLHHKIGNFLTVEGLAYLKLKEKNLFVFYDRLSSFSASFRQIIRGEYCEESSSQYKTSGLEIHDQKNLDEAKEFERSWSF